MKAKKYWFVVINGAPSGDGVRFSAKKDAIRYGKKLEKLGYTDIIVFQDTSFCD